MQAWPDSKLNGKIGRSLLCSKRGAGHGARLVDQRVPAICLSLAAARLMAELPSGKAPTTRVPVGL
jgi:hypothetical protein